MGRTDPRIAMLLDILDQSFDGHGWHGTTLRGALRGVTARQALWRPGPKRHNIWELVLHASYWKYAVARRLSGQKRGSFPRSPSNWPRVPARADAAAWRADLALLEAQHERLREVVGRLPPARLDAPSPRGKWKNADQIHGIAAHDLYHTGQIQLIKRLMPR
jgi:hypothetical protein